MKQIIFTWSNHTYTGMIISEKPYGKSINKITILCDDLTQFVIYGSYGVGKCGCINVLEVQTIN